MTWRFVNGMTNLIGMGFTVPHGTVMSSYSLPACPPSLPPACPPSPSLPALPHSLLPACPPSLSPCLPSLSPSLPPCLAASFFLSRGGSRNFGKGAWPHANAEGTDKNEKVFFSAEVAQKMKIRVSIKCFPGIWDQNSRSYS